MITVHCLPSSISQTKASLWLFSSLRTQLGHEASQAGTASLRSCVPGRQNCLTLVHFFPLAKCKGPKNGFGYPAFLSHVKTLILKAGHTAVGCSRAQFVPHMLRAWVLPQLHKQYVCGTEQNCWLFKSVIKLKALVLFPGETWAKTSDVAQITDQMVLPKTWLREAVSLGAHTQEHGYLKMLKRPPPWWGLPKAASLEPLQNLEAAHLASLLFQLLLLLCNLEEGVSWT